MGTNASCSIVLTPIDKPFYWTGETVSGNVVLTIGTSVNLKSIEVAMIGQLIDTVTTNDSTHTVRQDFFVQKQPLFVPETNGISCNEVSHSHYSKMRKNETLFVKKCTYPPLSSTNRLK
jgi:hypothetical protein